MRKTGKIGRKVWPKCPGMVVRGRLFKQADLVLIRRIIRMHPSWGRTRISIAACKQLSWLQANGRPKERACRVALLRLEKQGLLRLPPRIVNNGGRPPAVHLSIGGIADSPDAVARMPARVRVAPVDSAEDRKTWNSLISRYHYLGLATPVGRLVRYLLYGDEQLLGAISFTDAAWRVTTRDRILARVGIQAVDLLDSVINNARYLILPTVTVPNLASRMLAASLAEVRGDWYSRYGVAPSVVETFVDESRFRGTCYLAANWFAIGSTSGFSKSGSTHRHNNQRKLVFLRGLTPKVNDLLRDAIAGAMSRAA